MQKSSNFRYWMTLISCCGLTGSSIGILTNSMGVFYSPISAGLGVGRGAIAMHATLSMLTIAFLSPLAAKLLTRVPLRLYLGLGTVLSVGATFALSFSTNIWAFYILGVVKGVGITFFGIIAVTTIISNWFFKNHGLAVGVALSFSGLCGAIFSPLFTAIIEGFGWRAALACMAAFTLLLALPGVLTLRLTPQECSMAPYGGQGISMPSASGVSEKGKAKLYMPALVLMCVFSLLLTGTTSVGQHFPSVAEAAGFSAQVGAMMISAGMVGNIVSKFIIGLLSDHKGAFFASTVMILVNVLALGVLLRLPSGVPAVAIGSAFFYGAVYSVSAVGFPLLTRRVFGHEQYTAAYSIVQVFANGGGALALTVIGIVYDMTGSCDLVLLGSIVIQAANLAMLFVLNRMRKQNAR